MLVGLPADSSFGPPDGPPFGPPDGPPFGPPDGPPFGPQDGPFGPPDGPSDGPPDGPLDGPTLATKTTKRGITANRHPKQTQESLERKLENNCSKARTPSNPVSNKSASGKEANTQNDKETDRQVEMETDVKNKKDENEKKKETTKENKEKETEEKQETEAEETVNHKHKHTDVTHNQENKHTQKGINQDRPLRQPTLTPVDVNTSNHKLKKLTQKQPLKKRKANQKLSQAQPSNSIVNYVNLLPKDGVQGAKGGIVGDNKIIRGLTLTETQGPGQDDNKLGRSRR